MLFLRYFIVSLVSSVAQLCLTLCNPINCSTPGLPVHHQLQEFTQTHPSSLWPSRWPSSHLILCHPLLLLTPIPPSIRVFSNESTLRMRWTKYYCNIIQWCSQGCLGLLLGLPESSLLFFHRMWWENPIELLGPSIDCLSLYYPVSSYLKHFLLLSL